MKFVRFCYFLFGVLFVFQTIGQTGHSSPKFEILVYGRVSNNAYRDAENIVADRWNIRLKSIVTCMVPTFLKDSAEVFNRRSDSLISLKYGKNWRQKFDKEIAKEKKFIEKLIARIKPLEYISQLNSALSKEGNEVYYMVYPYSIARSEKKYEVFVYGWGTINGETDLVCYYKFKVFKHKKAIDLVTDKPFLLFN